MSCSVHDLAEYETNGVPSVLVATEQFATATTAQAGALGTEPSVVYVQHPIQDRTDAELRQIADGAIEALLGALLVS